MGVCVGVGVCQGVKQVNLYETLKVTSICLFEMYHSVVVVMFVQRSEFNSG